MTRTKKPVVVEEQDLFDPYAHIDHKLDAIEKHFSLSGSTMDKGELRISSGMLTLDLILGGGIVGGGWYTLFGMEQSGKSTVTTTIMTAALNTEVPIVSLFDYEGCTIGETKLIVNNVATTIGNLCQDLAVGETRDLRDKNLYVTTAYGQALITSVTNKGPNPITKATLEDGSTLSGYRHPVLVCTHSELLEYKYLEDLQVGDLVVCQ